MSVFRAMSSLMLFGLAVFVCVPPAQAQEGDCENCLGEGGMPEPCSDENGFHGYLDCKLILWFFCSGEERCDIQPTDALALGFDGLPRGQMTPAQMEAAASLNFQSTFEWNIPASGPAESLPELGTRSLWRDCRGQIKGVLRTDLEREQLRSKTQVILF